MSRNHNRSNTAVNDEFLHKNVLLCCGEDAAELMSAIAAAGVGPVIDSHDYRCYRFWRFSDFVLIWTGIGTGCLEPLLYEILVGSPIERICLIGTAGMCRAREGLVKGQIYLIEQARTWAAGVSPIDQNQSPNWPNPITNCSSATILSTDYYYGLSRMENPQLQKLRGRDRALSADFREVLRSVDLIDMEVAQFYFLCSVLGSPDLQWVAFKGPANALDNYSEQIENSPEILSRAVKIAVDVFSTSRG